jgi:SAM-dependent methyltransferase
MSCRSNENRPPRARARELAAEFLAKGDPTGWFEQLYCEAAEGTSVIPWADLRPNPNLIEFWRGRQVPAAGKTALKIGCGLGDDAEQLAVWGFETTAFDISASAIQVCNQRFPGHVTFTVADILNPPAEWTGYFDFVLESYTLQVLPPIPRRQALLNAANLVKEGGLLLLIARGRDEDDPQGKMPWPLTRRELEEVSTLRALSFEDYWDNEMPPVRRFRVLYEKRSRV